jgi:regulator of sigma E protease
VHENLRALGEIVAGERRIVELGGPVKIAELSGETVTRYGFGMLVLLVALLSINVGIVNLLPIPVLDGGHLLFMGIETIRRRPLHPRVVEICSIGGLAALLVLFVLITTHDIVRLVGIG